MLTRHRRKDNLVYNISYFNYDPRTNKRRNFLQSLLFINSDSSLFVQGSVEKNTVTLNRYTYYTKINST